MYFKSRTLSVAALLIFFAASLSGAAESASSDGLFGFGQGYFHPTLRIATEYTDNYKQTPVNEESDWQTTVSPGFWLAVPATRIPAPYIASSNTAAGGQAVSRFQEGEYKGFQGSLMYNADILRSHDHSDEDETRHRAQGMLQYAFAGGLSLEASHVYIQSSEEYADTISNELEEYESNLFNLIAFYKVSPKLALRAGYSNFDLEYTSGQLNDYKERTDNMLSSYVFYSILPKTDLFIQYDYVDVDYDLDIKSDKEVNRYFLGVRFDSRARITGHAKIGYTEVEDDDNNNDFDDFSGYASLGYAFGDRSEITLTAEQSVDISDEVIYSNVLHNEVGLALDHNLSHKVRATFSVSYEEDEYRFSDDTSGREDEDLEAGVRLRYRMKDWLTLGARYAYTDRDSNVDSQEYQENKLMFTVSARL